MKTAYDIRHVSLAIGNNAETTEPISFELGIAETCTEFCQAILILIYFSSW